ncbi:hypothetical protein Curi_c26930 [Gottschalkia acidurici 9a]|uniref:Uncharacterized protein n=1 Tax=Gottschalkia acidurici (strain ATCC 7906 / DSM 604 / BCRC 14475 / CIP 104303 / KCTC 5404 / NCIMB 10678 / 9a) TaxID=1128398 RepID=K0B561_GOTA9|nr:hypothetical protein [Gottschalkia acidurici]AFS79686.1 hypothetical protein Curi_c26930 [Gottschalkia acidurici 9a]
MSKKNTFTNHTGLTNSLVNKKESEDYVQIINSKKYTIKGKDKIPTRVEPSMNSVTRV